MRYLPYIGILIGIAVMSIAFVRQGMQLRDCRNDLRNLNQYYQDTAKTNSAFDALKQFNDQFEQ